MTTPKTTFAGLALIVALCGGFVSMSAFGGKADVNHCVDECPLLAKSGLPIAGSQLLASQTSGKRLRIDPLFE